MKRGEWNQAAKIMAMSAARRKASEANDEDGGENGRDEVCE